MPSQDFYDGVRAAIAALPGEGRILKPAIAEKMSDWLAGWNECRMHCADLLNELLPKPDVAKVLVERWIESDDPHAGTDKVAFAQWLLSEGLVNIEKVGE